MKNRDQIQESITCYNLKLILLSETRTTADVQDVEVKFENYFHIRCDSTSRHTGDVMLYINKSYNFSNFKTFQLRDNYWCKVVKVDMKSAVCLVGCLYHSPSSSDVQFIEELEEICDVLFSTNYRCVLVGDFNVDLLASNFYGEKIKKLFSSYGVKQYITSPTRITN